MSDAQLPTAEVEHAGESSPEKLNLVLQLARSMKAQQLHIEKLEAELADRSKALKKIAEVDIPNALNDAGLEEMPLGEGWTVKIKNVITGSISEANKERAHEWLEKHGMGGLIKHVITISFGRDEDRWAKKFLADCAKRKKPLNASRKDAVNSQTLSATVREQIQLATDAGEDPRQRIPFDLFGVFELKKAELVEPKAKKGATL